VYVGHRLTSRVGEHYPDGRNGGSPSIPAIIIADSLGIEYDASGNVTFQTLIKRRRTGDPKFGWTSRDSVGHSWNFNYYDGTERLRYAQRTTMNQNDWNKTVFSEYWYDALGRRIATRSRVDSIMCPSTEVVSPLECQQEWLVTTWDGDQVLFESRQGGGWQQPDNAVGTYPISATWYGDVRYTQTGAIDAPVVLWRNGEYPRVLHRNWRGTVAGATFAAGPSVGSVDATTVWPAAVSDIWYDPDARQSAPAPNKWLGSLVTEGRDATGTLYRRNRYYDPVSGRFTQEDPIGLAGGLNLYGYAAGDPINFSDPFGTCPCLLAVPIASGGIKLAAAVTALILAAKIASDADAIPRAADRPIERRLEVFHREESPTQTPADAAAQQASGELWGKGYRDAGVPYIQAFRGPLRAGQRGIEFTTPVRPSKYSKPGQVQFLPGQPGVRVEDGVAKMPIVVIKNTQTP
jgi:RHS repeat-associated protein